MEDIIIEDFPDPAEKRQKTSESIEDIYKMDIQSEEEGSDHEVIEFISEKEIKKVSISLP